jgi:hypothetical protein
MIDAYRMVLMSKLNYYMSIMNYMSSQAALEQSIGLDINQITEKLR